MTEDNGMNSDYGEDDAPSNNVYEDLLNELAVLASTMSVRQEYPSDYGVQAAGTFYVGLMLCRRLMMLGEQLETISDVIDNSAELLVDLQATLTENNRETCKRLESIDSALENIAQCMPHE